MSLEILLGVPLSTPYTRQSRPSMWNHNFLCLARFCVHVPNREEKERLMAAGLGEKRGEESTNSSVQLHEKLLMVCPKLQHARSAFQLSKFSQVATYI